MFVTIYWIHCWMSTCFLYLGAKIWTQHSVVSHQRGRTVSLYLLVEDVGLLFQRGALLGHGPLVIHQDSRLFLCYLLTI